jgi:hypothetical protein
MGGWVGWEPDRTRVLGDLAQPQRGGVVDEHTEDASTDRDVADGGPLGLGDPCGDELADGAVGMQHAKRAVAGPGEVGRQLPDALEDDGQREL